MVGNAFSHRSTVSNEFYDQHLSESIRMPVLQTAQKSLDRLASRTPWLRLAKQREKPFRRKFSGHLACSAKVPNTEVEIQSQLPLQAGFTGFSVLSESNSVELWNVLE